MDELISRQKALEHLRKRLIQTANNNVGFVCDAGLTFEDASERVKTWLDEVPSIDAVPVIRCKDCKYARMTYDGDCKYCDVWFPDEAEYLDGDYYCASAERKEQ